MSIHDDQPDEGELRVWHIPQVPMPAFYWTATDLAHAKDLCAMLAAYDTFQYKHNVKPDYSSVQGIERWEVYDGVGDWWDVDEEELEELKT